MKKHIAGLVFFLFIVFLLGLWASRNIYWLKTTPQVVQFTWEVKNNPDSSWSHAKLANLHHNRGELALASKHYRDAVRLDPSDVSNRIQLAQILSEKGLYAKALKQYREVFRISPSQPHIHSWIARTLAAQGKVKEAINEERKEIAIFRNYDPTGHINLSLYLKRDGQLEEALKELQVAMSLDDGTGAYFYWLGDIYKDMGKNSEAIEAYKKYLEVPTIAGWPGEKEVRKIIEELQT